MATAISELRDAQLAAVIDAWTGQLANPATRRAYQSALADLLSRHQTINPGTLAQWRDELAAAKLGRATIRRRLAAVRSFARWAHSVGRLREDRLQALLAIQAPNLRDERLPRAPSDAELVLLRDAPARLYPRDLIRQTHAAALVAVLEATGIRIAELHAAKRSHMRPARPVTTARAELAGRVRTHAWLLDVVDGKGGVPRTVPLPRRAAQALYRYARAARFDEHPGCALHPTLAAGRGPGRVASPDIPTSPRGARALLTRLAAANGIDPKVTHPHALRHAFALNELRRGQTLGQLQRRLGHADTATTARYLRAVQDDDEHPDDA